ncbi:helix-turn-helix domain-containing protein [Pseudoclavibacter sp. RFBA6]|uniref:helix-turn-helix domain-containing protein n=1 Tax=Pseudoclavibacter sp. RFBA6 TaxID=2080573 RepID=UPI000CE8862B|nr:helix-turn-helix domain-containing protein [Pseudoclavibacter sp. RFBA6]PPG38026.1 hypothetical protein C5C17_15335 [Pseudoclavibacter sp. RFBA6]
MERLLTEKETAELLQLRQQLLREWRDLDKKDAGRRGPPFKKLGRAVRYRATEVSAWIDAAGDIDV